MALFHNPQIATSGLVFAYDSANRKSYQGPPIQNRMTSVTPSAHGSGTGYSFVTGSEVSDIPSVGPTLVQYSNIQNTGASWCCPNPFAYMNGGTVSVSGSTLYTYALLYRVESGYTNGNYMYRYEYNSGGGYLTEAGVHSDSNRVHLGNGWYWAWGTFTTQATASYLNVYSFYYRYSSSYDKMSVANVLLVAGDYTGLHPRYWPDVNTTRATTAAIVDMTGGNAITASSLTYASNGTISFNGSSNYIDVTSNLGVMSTYTISFWAKRDAENRMPIGWRGGPTFYWYGDNSWYYTHGGVAGEYYYAKPTSIPLGTWGHYCVVYNGANVSIYRQGIFQGSQNTTGTADWTNGMRIGYWAGGSSYYWQGSIDSVSMHNRALSAAEVLQNFNALRGRYGL
jgi:hypothetical protein